MVEEREENDVEQKWRWIKEVRKRGVWLLGETEKRRNYEWIEAVEGKVPIIVVNKMIEEVCRDLGWEGKE
jgi:hypothetical protein